MKQQCKHINLQTNPTLDTVWGLDDNYNIVCKDCKIIIAEDITKEQAESIIKHLAYSNAGEKEKIS